MPVIRKKNFDYTLHTDDGDVRLKLKRLTVAEFEEFNAMFGAWSKGRGNPGIRPAPEDDAASMERLRAEVKYGLDYAAWATTVFEKYISVVDGDLFNELEDGRRVPVTTGSAFADMFSADAALLGDVVYQLWVENKLSDTQKKTLRLLLASVNGSTTASPTAEPGQTPETVATSAEPANSAELAAATAPSSAESSGTTGP